MHVDTTYPRRPLNSPSSILNLHGRPILATHAKDFSLCPHIDGIHFPQCGKYCNGVIIIVG